MINRIVRTIATLLAVLAAYQAYVLVAVPVLEPPLAVRQVRPSTAAERARAEQALTKYQRLLAAYFPSNHWTQSRPPKVIGTNGGQLMLVLDDYRQHEDGGVDLTQCALLFFPTMRQEGLEPPRDAIIVEAPRGAHFQFDGKFQPERGNIPPLLRGQLPGRITIRSDMHAPGPEDDLLIETTDVEMNSKLLYTTSPVRFRLGPNQGGGRELEIRFLVDEHARPSKSEWSISGLDSLEIRQEVRLRVLLEADSLLPGDDRDANRSAASAASYRRLPPTAETPAGVRLAAAEVPAASRRPAKEPPPPVEVTCAGPFHFDFVRYVASFDRDVELWQINRNGPGDQLSCQELDLHFAPRAEPGSRRQPRILDAGRRQQQDLPLLEPAKIVARGHPVVVVSPSRRAEARGGRIQLGLRDRKLAIDGGSDVTLTYGPNVLCAPAIQYEHPPAEATTRIGGFWADGPGSLRYTPDEAKPDQTLEAKWQTSVELGRHNGQPVLALAGRPQLAFATMGRLVADQMKVYLREVQGAAAAAVRLPGATDGPRKLAVVPDRMTAVGRVQFQSPELSGQAHELAALFRVEPARDVRVADQTGGVAPRHDRAVGDQSRRQTYQIEADHLRIEIALRGERAQPTGLSCEGNVALRQLPHSAASGQPLEVRGGQLKVTNLDTSARLQLVGTAPGEPAGARLAQFHGRGVTLRAAGVELDQAQNRLWIDGPGEATMLVTRDLEGRATASPEPLDITWQGGLTFDGHQLLFDRQVLIQGADDWIRCQQLVARLSQPVTFGSRVNQDAIDLAEIECRGQVVMEHRSRDTVGPTSHERMELERLAINQQTGVVDGSGPGSVRSTHFGSQAAALAGPASPDRSDDTQLQFLRVDFEHGLSGNLYTRELVFHGRVRTVYGAVDSWEQELDINRPESWPPGSVSLTCRQLGVNEDPVAARTMPRSDAAGSRALGPMELRAEGDVRIDGQSPSAGTFAAQADRATYQQVKDLFILEGSARTPATIWQQRQLGSQHVQNSARKIQYWRATGQVKVEDIRVFEFTPPTAPPAAPQDARRPSPSVR